MATLTIYKILNDLFFITIIPGIFVIIWLFGLITLGTLLLCLFGSFIVLVILPLVFRNSIRIQREFLFLTLVRNPMTNILKTPSKSGLYAARNFYVTYNDELNENKEIKLGVWHILPNNISKRFSKQLNLTEESINQINDNEETIDETTDLKMQDVEKYIESLNNQEEDYDKKLFEATLKLIPGTIILYLHGNSATRATGHRVELYKLFQKLNYHVLTFDYRSFGDSSNTVPITEDGVVSDATAILKYITNITDNPVFLWGHSLGTGVSTHMLSNLHDNSKNIKGVILESPFSSIRDEVREHTFAKIFKNLPWFEYTIVDGLYKNLLRFESSNHISKFRQPVCILHAEDDLVVPFKLGYKLYRTALNTRNKGFGPIEFHRFVYSSKYGHKNIYQAPNLPEITQNFVDNYRNEQF